MSFRLGSFQLGDTAVGRIVELRTRGVLVDFGAEQPAFVRQSELSLAEIQFPEEILQLNQVREFLVMGNYDGQCVHFFPDCTPEMLEDSDRPYKVAQYRASLGCRYLIDRADLLVHTQILAVQPDGVFAKIQWFLCSERSPTITFSIRELEIQTAWKRIRQLQAENVTLYPKVTTKSRNSATVEIEGLKGLISNVDRYIKELVVGEEPPLKILAVHEELNHLTLIRCSTLIKLSQLQIGQLVSGTVQSIKPYGVFVDIGGLHAFLHASKIIPTVGHPAQLFKVNDSVKMAIAEIDLEKPYVALKSCEELV